MQHSKCIPFRGTEILALQSDVTHQITLRIDTRVTQHIQVDGPLQTLLYCTVLGATFFLVAGEKKAISRITFSTYKGSCAFQFSPATMTPTQPRTPMLLADPCRIQILLYCTALEMRCYPAPAPILSVAAVSTVGKAGRRSNTDHSIKSCTEKIEWVVQQVLNTGDS